MIRRALRFEQEPAIQRLARLVPLDRQALASLQDAMAQRGFVRPRQEIQFEGASVAHPRLVLAGWAARVRTLIDGRQQFLSFLLPGDLIGACRQRAPLAVTTVVAVSEVTLCPLPLADHGSPLDQAYAISQAIDEACLLEQIARLGLFNAYERIVSLLLELHERLLLAGLVEGNSFTVPLTQEKLAEATGISTVHVNRVLQQARRNRDLIWQGGRVTLLDPASLAKRLGRSPIRVSSALQA